MKNLFSVTGKVAVVTGGSRGIGAMFARGFVENGVKTYITSRKADELKQTADELSKSGQCIALASNLSTFEGIQAFTEELRARESKIDILINNAGASWGADITDFPVDGWDKVMALNLRAPFFLVQQFLPLLKASATEEDPARVINVASIAGICNPKMNNYSYAASKAGMIQMTRHMATDLAADDINVNAIAPGPFPSNMTKSFIAEDGTMSGVNISVPRKRVGKPEDAAGAAIYLSSPASAWITGHTLTLDGGIVASAG
jgi:NAD(P)-dependent dehydrogenase (short-subunit alcohol dehydrogenase family)